MWSPWAQGKRLIRGCKRQTELKETQQQHLILFLAYPVQGVMLNICFVGCGIKPELEKYLTVACCPLHPSPILRLNSLLSSPCWIFTPSRGHCTIVWLNFKITGLVLSQSLCEGAGPFIHQALLSKSPDSVVVTLEKSHFHFLSGLAWRTPRCFYVIDDQGQVVPLSEPSIPHS